ncbi:hypothetical protein SAMN07250955_109102 [Arboricoccus pini]|uniref:Uncharacterized protein n=1 Tax=Arboricoccus pini TaxID=1963835 RepID=A0A212RJ74_9PROT|nr:hypothetical protein [Arboricoccus pini]SNB72462.1 hypothetical protein SAMN07250955_109102 [Arboricoccus pini]
MDMLLDLETARRALDAAEAELKDLADRNRRDGDHRLAALFDEVGQELERAQAKLAAAEHQSW